jgi:hypothetical protein
MSKFNTGDRVKVVRQTDVDTGTVFNNVEEMCANPDFKDDEWPQWLFGKTGVVIGYESMPPYDISVRLDEAFEGYEAMRNAAFLEGDLEHIDRDGDTVQQIVESLFDR